MTPQDFIKIRNEQQQIIEFANAKIYAAKRNAGKCKLPHNLRAANAQDVFVDAVLWFPDFNGRKWVIVEEVLRPDDNWKAFCADDACRYGLYGAFVEIEETL